MSVVEPIISDHAIDDSGHYLYLIDDAFAGPLGDAEIESLADYIATPLGGYRPLPQARRFHQSQAQYRFCLGGNRSSKSHAVAHEVAMLALDVQPWRRIGHGITAWYATQTFEMVGAILWPKLERLIEGWDYDATWISKGENIPRSVRVRRSDGEVSRITFKAYEQGRETFQGTDLDLVAFDEQFPQDVYTEAVTRIGAAKRLLFIAGLTPIDPQPWFESKLGNQKSVGMEVFEFPLDDNRISCGGFIDDVEIDAVIAEWPEEVVETRRLGKWGSHIGAIFQSFKREIHVVQPDREHLFILSGDESGRFVPPGFSAIGSIDWGGANPFVFLWGIRLHHLDDAWYIFDEYYHDSRKRGQRRLEEHADHIKSTTHDRWRTTLDHSWADHDPTDAYEMFSYGVPSHPAHKDVRAGIEHMQTLLKVRHDTGRPRLYIASRCENLIRELATYRWAEGTEKKDGKDEPVKKDDHAVDACRYLLFSERGSGEEYAPIDLGAENQRTF